MWIRQPQCLTSDLKLLVNKVFFIFCDLRLSSLFEHYLISLSFIRPLGDIIIYLLPLMCFICSDTTLTNILQNVKIGPPEMVYYFNFGRLDLNNSLLILPIGMRVRYDSFLHTN